MKIYKLPILLLFFFILLGCNNNKKTEHENLSTQIKPQCKLTESEPCTSSSCIKVHAICSGGSIPIEEAYITLDTQHKSVPYSGNNIDAFISFDNLQPNSAYKAELTVIVDGEAIKESIVMKTRNKGVVCKNPDELHIRSLNLPADGTILDLNTLCVYNGVIQYEIKSTNFTEGQFLNPEDENTTPGYNLYTALNINNGKLQLKYMPLPGGSGIIVIQAKSLEGNSDIIIKLSIESLYLP